MKEIHIYGSPEQLGEFMADENARKVLDLVDAMHCHFRHAIYEEYADAKTAPSAKETLDAIDANMKRWEANGFGLGELRQKEGMTLAEAKADFDEFGSVGAKRTVAGHEYQDAVCKQCGKAFKSYHGRAKFCSAECKRIHTNKQKKRPKTEKTTPPEPSKAFKKEAAARAEGKRYADLQKADTLEKFGRVEK